MPGEDGRASKGAVVPANWPGELYRTTRTSVPRSPKQPKRGFSLDAASPVDLTLDTILSFQKCSLSRVCVGVAALGVKCAPVRRTEHGQMARRRAARGGMESVASRWHELRRGGSRALQDVSTPGPLLRTPQAKDPCARAPEGHAAVPRLGQRAFPSQIRSLRGGTRQSVCECEDRRRTHEL
eukprot:scaffold1452_cov236-Pinguiococcus_pyrenoidosus.AAC.7